MSRLAIYAQLLVLAACAALMISEVTARAQEPFEEPEIRLPGGKIQKDELLRRDHEENLRDAARLVDLAQSLKAELEKSGPRILSVRAVKTTEEIERLSKRIRGRMRR
ncbi:MAG: hypothetical protein ACUVXB_12450 [Bryobacteraceae bacterium]